MPGQMQGYPPGYMFPYDYAARAFANYGHVPSTDQSYYSGKESNVQLYLCHWQCKQSADGRSVTLYPDYNLALLHFCLVLLTVLYMFDVCICRPIAVYV